MNTAPVFPIAPLGTAPATKIPDRVIVYPINRGVELPREHCLMEQMNKTSRPKRPVNERTLKPAAKAQKSHEAVKIERNAEETSVAVSALTMLRNSE